MSKKLLIAVLTLGLLVAFGGVAIAGDIDNRKTENEELITYKSRPNDIPVEIVNEASNALEKPAAYRHLYASPTTVFPPAPVVCSSIVPHSDVVLGYEPVPIYSYGVDFMNMRFRLPAPYPCTLTAINIGIDQDAYVGNPDMEVSIFSGCALNPGTTVPVDEYYRFTVPWAELPQGTGPAWVTIDLTGMGVVFDGGTMIKVGVTVDAASQALEESFGILWDDASVTTFDYRFGVPAGASACYVWTGCSENPGTYCYQAYLINIEICSGEDLFSNCDQIQDYVNYPYTTYWWFSDDPDYIDYRNVRFTGLDDTLTGLTVGIYALEDMSEVYNTEVDIDVIVTGSSGGYPDMSDILWSTTIQGEDVNVGTMTGNFVSLGSPIAVKGDFHGVVSIGDGGLPGYAGILSGAAGAGTGRSGALDNSVEPPEWYTSGRNYGIQAHLCLNRYGTCITDADYLDYGPYFIRRLPGSYGTRGYFQKIQSIGLGCRLEEIRAYFYQSETAAPYATSAQIRIYDNDGAHDIYDPGGPDEFDFEAGLPGTLVHTIEVTGAEIIANGFQPNAYVFDVSAENIRFDEYVWVGIEIMAPDGGQDMILRFNPGAANGYYTEYETALFGNGPFAPWEYNTQGFTYEQNFWSNPKHQMIDVDVCCEPPPEAECSETGDDWPTASHDFRRTARSFSSSGDARCLQDLAWDYKDPLSLSYGRGLIADGILVVPFASAVRAWDLALDSDVPIWEVSGLPNMGTANDGSVAQVDGKVVFPNGNGQGLTCVDLYTGAIIWCRGLFPTGFTTGYSVAWVQPVILGDVVYASSQEGTDGTAELRAWNMADGTDFGGWAVQPVLLDGATYTSLSSNGADVLYVGTNGNGNTGDLEGVGSFYAIDAADGSIIFQMQGDDWGTYRYDIDGAENTIETWQEGSAVIDVNGDIYVRSDFQVEASGAPAAALYKLNSAGVIQWGVATEYPSRGALLLDVNIVYVGSWAGWANETGGLKAYNKISGNMLWDAAVVNAGNIGPLDAWEFYNTTNGWGAIDCQTLMRDLVYMPTGRLEGYAVYNGENGTLEFEYLLDPSSNYSSGVLLDDNHVVFQNRAGEVYVMENGAEEIARLRILKAEEFQPVPFLVGPGYAVPTFEDVFMNAGCANLTGTLTADEVAPSISITSVDPSRIRRMGSLANKMIRNSYPEMIEGSGKLIGINDVDIDMTAFAKDSYSNSAAYAQPAWLTSFTETFNLGDGDMFSMDYIVDGDLVTRGAHDCYFTINSNAQYYLNNPEFMPAVNLGVIGGCLASFDTLYWGTEIQHYSIIYNNGMIAQDARDLGLQFWVGGSEDYWCYFIGFLMFGQDDRSFAVTNATWAADDYETLLADPNCSGECISYVERDIVLGSFKPEGETSYQDIRGEAVTYAYIDSVIDFGCHGDWDWTALDCNYSNDLTMGMSFKCTEYGAYGVPDLNNILITRLEISNRNTTAIDDPVYWAQHVDHDLGYAYPSGEVLGGYNFGRFFFLDDYDVAWGGACSDGYEVNTNVFGSGTIGIPMNGVVTCGQDLINVFDDAEVPSLYDLVIDWCKTVDGEFFYPEELDPDPDGDGVYECTPFEDAGDIQATYLYDGFTLAAAGEEGDMVDIGMYRFGYSLDYETLVGPNTFDTALIENTAIVAQQFAGFNRGDGNGDGVINLADVVYLYNYINGEVEGPKFQHLADVDASGEVDLGDVRYLCDFCFCVGNAPIGEWVLPDICPEP
ncbi:MAG: dockerin type I domain-containing protein [candidate division Zixibacteria bacterium]